MATNAVLAQGGISALVVQVDTVTAQTTTTGWVTPAARTASFASDVITGVAYYSSAFVTVDIITGTGTIPTLDVYIQREIPDGASPSRWCDIAAFTQFTSTAAAQRGFGLVSGGNQEFTVTSSSLTGATSRSVPFGQTWRVFCTIAGTNPSWTFAVYASFNS